MPVILPLKTLMVQTDMKTRFLLSAMLLWGLFLHTGTQAQTPGGYTVHGYVSDSYGPVTGAAVFVKNANDGVVTDSLGLFTLNGVKYKETIVVSMVGYSSQEIRYTGQDSLSIGLREETSSLNEAVVTALGIERNRMALSYNIQQVRSEAITKVKDANFVNSLIGKVAGVQISSGAAGQGSASRVVMRGMNSIEKSNSALYVIDGVPMYNSGSKGGRGIFGGAMGTEAAADINPEDIESVSMLTGAAAAALYGSAAANGVVLITTRKGKEGRATVTFTNSTFFSRITELPQLQSRYGGKTINSWEGPLSSSNYAPEDFFQTSFNTMNSISVTGGSEKNITYVSASSTNTDNILPGARYNRYNFTGRNVSRLAGGRVTLDFGINYIIQNNRNLVAQGRYYNPLPALYLFPRAEDYTQIREFERYDSDRHIMAQYWPYGNGDHDLQNPYWIMKRMVRDYRKQRYIVTASVRWDITPWLNLTARGNADNTYFNNMNKNYATTLTTFTGDNGGYSESLQQDNTYYGDVILNVDKKWGDWGLNATAGGSIQDLSSKSTGASGWLRSPNYFAFNNLNLEQGFSVSRGKWHDQTQSVFGSVEASWKKAIFLTLTGRNDWASQLAFSSTPCFFYPSAGISAVISNMVCMPDWFSLLKVRASYSEVASPFARYLSNPGYVFNSQTQTWSKPTTYPAHDLKPERTKSWEAGLTMHFLGSIELDATYYRTNTFNQTIYAPLSASTGYSNFIAQTGNIQNEGIELALRIGRSWHGFTWDSGLTYTMNRNRIVSLAHGIPDPITGKSIDITEIRKADLGYGNVAPKVILREGGTLSDIYTNHRLVRNADGRLVMKETEYEYAGQLEPKGNMGWSNSFGWKGVSLSFVITARFGGKTYSATQGILDYYGASEASARARDEKGVIWEGNRYDPQEFYRAISTAQGGHGAYYLYDATNIRLQELSIQYTFPRKWFKDKAGLTLGFTARNLWMIYCKSPFDPELTGAAADNYYQGVDYFMMPGTRDLGFNVRLTF